MPHKPIIESELKEMKERCEAATPGPWDGSNVIWKDPFKYDEKFVEAARADMPRLIAEVERQKANALGWRQESHQRGIRICDLEKCAADFREQRDQLRNREIG